MYEPDTLAPSYDARRGEGTTGRVLPREGLRTQEERQAKGHGDCIDCGFCVQVCPTGVDIRKGLQYQCISCGLCIDACNNIMDSMGWKRGLIRYDSERNLNSENPGKPHLVWKRLKVIGYALALIIMMVALIYRVETRANVEVLIEQERQPLYIHLSDDKIRKPLSYPYREQNRA
jgi:polyferredoxin